MARVTKETEYNELAKFGECFKQTNNYGGYGIVVNEYGDAVLWRSYLTPSDGHTAQRWHQIDGSKGRQRPARILHNIRRAILSR